MIASITNRTRNVMLHERPEMIASWWGKACGFMFSTPGDRALVFIFLPPRKVALHMWFVFGSIDVICLDGQGTVVALRERLAPWSYWRSPSPIAAVLELPAGTIARSGTSVGDRVLLPAVGKRWRQA